MLMSSTLIHYHLGHSSLLPLLISKLSLHWWETLFLPSALYLVVQFPHACIVVSEFFSIISYESRVCGTEVRHVYNLRSDPPIPLASAWHHTQPSQRYWLHSLCRTLNSWDCFVTTNLCFFIPLLFSPPPPPPPVVSKFLAHTCLPGSRLHQLECGAL